VNHETTELQSPAEKAGAPAATKPRLAAHTAPVVRRKRATLAKASAARKPSTKRAFAKSAPIRPATARRGANKTERILALLKRPNGTTLKELIKATGWQPHSVRGFLSGVIGRKLKLKVASVKDDSGARRYSIKS
jgi:hypothetical protein